MKKQKRKINYIRILGIALILTGGFFIAKDYIVDLQEKNHIKKDIEDFLNSAGNPNIENPTEADDTSIWGVVEIPSIDVTHPLVVSNNWALLNRYIVAYPNGNTPPEEGNFSMAAHNGRCAACVFTDLKHAELGDIVTLRTKDKLYTYEIKTINENVHYTDISVLDSVEGKTEITLITCMIPSNYDEYRLIVKAELVEIADI